MRTGKGGSVVRFEAGPEQAGKRKSTEKAPGLN